MVMVVVSPVRLLVVWLVPLVLPQETLTVRPALRLMGSSFLEQNVVTPTMGNIPTELEAVGTARRSFLDVNPALSMLEKLNAPLAMRLPCSFPLDPLVVTLVVIPSLMEVEAASPAILSIEAALSANTTL
jgi:hypothetical protein